MLADAVVKGRVGGNASWGTASRIRPNAADCVRAGAHEPSGWPSRLDVEIGSFTTGAVVVPDTSRGAKVTHRSDLRTSRSASRALPNRRNQEPETAGYSEPHANRELHLAVACRGRPCGPRCSSRGRTSRRAARVRLPGLHPVRLRQRSPRPAARWAACRNRVREVRDVEQVEDLRAELEVGTAAHRRSASTTTRSDLPEVGPWIELRSRLPNVPGFGVANAAGFRNSKPAVLDERDHARDEVGPARAARRAAARRVDDRRAIRRRRCSTRCRRRRRRRCRARDQDG